MAASTQYNFVDGGGESSTTLFAVSTVQGGRESTSSGPTQ